MKKIVLGIVVYVTVITIAVASESSYKGQEYREIKTLSQQKADGYLNGKGMGYAKAAELNHYPGPKHVLDLAQALALTEEQTKQTKALYETMKDRAMDLGKQLIAKERELDHQFASGTIDAGLLSSLVSEIGALEAKIRYVHLAAHLEQKALLNQDQVKKYNEFRGYGSNHGIQHHAH